MTQVIQEIKKINEQKEKLFQSSFKSLEESILPNKDHFEQVREKSDSVFGLTYTLDASLKAIEVVIKEKPSRELSLIKTHIQEAIHWLDEIK